MAEEPKRRKGIVAMLDVLGTRQLTAEDSLRLLGNRDSFIQNMNEVHSRMAKTSQGPLPQIELPMPKTATFQDTIIITWDLTDKEPHWASPERFLPLAAEWLRPSIMAGLQHQLLLRGAVSMGEYVQGEDSILGPAIADAATWYEKADWLGIVLTPTCGLRLAWLAERMRVREGYKGELPSWFVEYDVPLQGGKVNKMWTVSWPAQYPSGRVDGEPLKSDEDVQKAFPTGRAFFLYHMTQFSIPVGAETKYANTVGFFDWFQEKFGRTAHGGKDS